MVDAVRDPAPPASSPSPLRIVGALGATYLFWGGTFLAIRYAVAEVPPFLMIGIRCAGGAALLFGWAAWRGRLEPTAPTQWVGAFAAGGLLFLGCHGLLAWSEQRVSSGMASLYMAAIPLWLVLISAGVVRRLPSMRVGAGLVLGMLGVAWLSWDDGASFGAGIDRVALLVGGAMWAIGSIVGQRVPQPASVVQTTAMQLVGGAVTLVATSLLLGELADWHPDGMTARGGAALAFLIVFGTAVTFVAYTWLLRVTTPALAGSSAFVNPVVAVALGWLVQDGDTTARMVVAAPLVIAAVALSREPARARRAKSYARQTSATSAAETSR